jgi:hypothetical protein
MITLAADTREVKDFGDLMGILSEPRNLNPDAIIASVRRVLATFDVEDAARSQSQPTRRGCSLTPRLRVDSIIPHLQSSGRSIPRNV